jgi:hypothetical protein
MRRASAIVAAGIFVAALGGCSGGGGGGGGGGGTQGPLQYTGNANPAVITTSNAAVLAAIATDTSAGADVTGAFSSATPPSESQGGRAISISGVGWPIGCARSWQSPGQMHG